MIYRKAICLQVAFFGCRQIGINHRYNYSTEKTIFGV